MTVMEAILYLLFLLSFIPALLTLPETPIPSPESLNFSATAIFVLGDSSVSCGDNNILYTLLPHNFSSRSFCFGSSRRLIPDFIGNTNPSSPSWNPQNLIHPIRSTTAEKMGIPPPLPFYRGNRTPLAISAGVNFGSTPATIISPSTGTALSPIGTGVGVFLLQTLSQQVRQVYESLQLLSLGAGPTDARRVASSSLFFLSFGHDDYASIFAGGETAVAGHVKYGRRGIARLLVSEMIQAIKDLYNAGVRRMLVAGVGPLGCSPRLRWAAAHTLPEQRCIEEANDVVSDYNARLADEINEVRPVLTGAQIVFCDVFNGTMEIISNHTIYGFNNTRDACCGAGVFGGMIGCWAHGMACNESSTHIWWDMYGITESVAGLLANWSWSPVQKEAQICKPISIKELVS